MASSSHGSHLRTSVRTRGGFAAGRRLYAQALATPQRAHRRRKGTSICALKSCAIIKEVAAGTRSDIE